MNSALPGEARAPGAAEAERVDREVACLGWRLDAPAGMAPAGLSYALTAAFPFRPTVGIELPHAGQADGEFSSDPLLRDLAAHAGKATARSAATNTEHPRLTSGWPAARGHGGLRPCSPSPSRWPPV
jgi:hypothetical protein